ncbi:MAG: glycosyltransferase [Lachnospiraceae bacterium]|nr:glycosyltransferase [Lachnospiraceae bacterium]
MKVCLLNDSFPPVIDGVVNVVMNYANYLQRGCGAEVLVGTPRYPDTDYSAYPYPVVPYSSFNTASVTNGYRAGNPFREKAVSEMAHFQPDIIHTHCPASSTVIARLLREETDAPVIFTYHTKYDIDIRRAVKSELLAEEGIRAMISNIEACDDVWVVSRGAGESLTELGFTGSWHVMNNGVDFEKGRVSDEKVREATAGFDLPEDVPLLLYVGRLMNYKNLPLTLQALKMLKDEGMDFRMVLIGKGPDGDSLRRMAAELGLYQNENEPDRCIFTGPVYDREVLRAWNTRADLFVFPSTFDTNGLVVREAAACGLASVLVRGSCAAEGITDGRNGFLIDETPEALAAALKTLCADRNALRDAGLHAMNEIYASWETCVGEAYERYQYILEEKAAGRLPQRKREISDYLLEVTARSMVHRDRLRSVRNELLRDMRDTASGMMENFEEAGDSLSKQVLKLSDAADEMERMSDRFWENMAEKLRIQLEELRKM